METFYWVTLIVAVVLMVVILIGLGILMSNQTSQLTWPPKASTCPDYWNYNTETKMCEVPGSSKVNTGALYDSGKLYVDTQVKTYTYTDSTTTPNTDRTQYTDIASINTVAGTTTKTFPTAKTASTANWWSALNLGTTKDINHAPFPVIADTGTTWSFNPEDPRWKTTTDKSALCAKRTWAVNNNIEWDGVSNYSGC